MLELIFRRVIGLPAVQLHMSLCRVFKSLLFAICLGHALFSFTSIARNALSLYAFAFERQTMKLFINMLLTCILYCDANCTHPLAVVGDFNFHLDTPNNQDALKFNDLLDSMNLVQQC